MNTATAIAFGAFYIEYHLASSQVYGGLCPRSVVPNLLPAPARANADKPAFIVATKADKRDRLRANRKRFASADQRFAETRQAVEIPPVKEFNKVAHVHHLAGDVALRGKGETGHESLLGFGALAELPRRVVDVPLSRIFAHMSTMNVQKVTK